MSLVILILASWLAGRLLIRPGRFPLPLERLLFQLCLGFVMVATAVIAIGSVSLRAAFFCLLVFTAIGLASEGIQYSRMQPPPPEPKARRFSLVEILACAAGGVACLIALVGALAPATGWDAAVAHLALPAEYVRLGRIALLPGNEYSGFPHLVHSLYAIAFLAGGETNVQLLSWVFGVLCCGAVYALGCRVGTRETGILAGGILATAPIFYDQASTASIDLAFCTFTVMALAALSAWRQEGDDAGPGHRGFLVAAAVLAGASCGIRHTGYLVCVLLALAVFWRARGYRMQVTALFAAGVVAGALPWLGRSAWLVGNPFYPFFTSYLGSGVIPHRDIAGFAAHESIQGIDWRTLLMFPYDIVMRPQQFDGWAKSPGGLVLFLGIPGLFVGGRPARRLGLFALSGLVCFFFFQRYARYLLPFFAPMMVVAALAATRSRSLRPAALAALFVSFAFGLALDAGAVHFKIPVLAGLQTRDEYLESRVERYAAFRWVADNLPRDEALFSFDRRVYFFDRSAWQTDEGLKALRAERLEVQARWFAHCGIKWIFVPVTYIEESPGLHRAYLEMVTNWRLAPHYFRLHKSMELPREDGSVDRVELYEVRGDVDGGSGAE